MENASKALLMAAGVLIGILVLSLAVYLAISFSQLYYDIDKQNADQKMAQFNTQYTAYADRTDLTIYDVLTIVSYAKENNQNYRDEAGQVYSGEEQNIVTITLKRGINTVQNVQEKDNTYFDTIIKDDQSHLQLDAAGNWTLPLYTCSSITYNAAGRVKNVELKKN